MESSFDGIKTNMEHTPELSLSVLGVRTLAGFRTLLAKAPDQRELSSQYQRLLLWSASLGLVGSLQSPLERRLTNAELVRSIAADLLTQLRDCVIALSDIYSGKRLPYDVVEDVVSPSDTNPADNPDSSSESEDDDSSGGVISDIDNIPGEVEARLEELDDIVNKLYKFAVSIRNSATRSGPGDRNPFRKFSTEQQKDILRELGRAEEFLVSKHIQNSQEKIDAMNFQPEPEELSILTTRCGHANVFRRQLFTIWQERHDRDKRALESLDDVAQMHDWDTVETHEVEHPSQTADKATMKNSVFAPSVQQTITILNQERVRLRATGSTFSRKKRTAPSQVPGGEKPPWPPIDDLPTTEYFECPYCFLLCPERYRKDDHAWRAHLIQDLRPYMCTYTPCESAGHLYEHRDDWENHERYVHRKVWRCPDHLSEEFSEEEYAFHVHSVHKRYSVQMLSDEGRRAAESTATEYERSCPFCAKTFENCDDLETHIVYHLECIALLTLPQKAAADDDFDSQLANQVDDSRIVDSQLGEWRAADNGEDLDRLFENAHEAHMDHKLKENSLDLHQSQYHEALDIAKLVVTWRCTVGKETSSVYAGSEQFLESGEVDRKTQEEAHVSLVLKELHIRDVTPAIWNTESQKLDGHTDGVRAVAFSPDGLQLASASGDGTVRLWDRATGKEVQKLDSYTIGSGISSVAFSPNGLLLASAPGDSTISLWDRITGQEVRELTGHTDKINALAFSPPDGLLLASASWDRTVRLWDWTTGQEVRKLIGHNDIVRAIVFSPDGALLASASWDRTVRLWDRYTGQEMQSLEGHTGDVRGVVFSPDGSLLASASGDRTVRLWDRSTGEEIQKLKGHTDDVSAVAFSPDGLLLVSSSGDHTVRLWDRNTGQEIQRLEGHTDNVRSVVFSPDGSLIASASWDRTVRLWKRATGQDKAVASTLTSD